MGRFLSGHWPLQVEVFRDSDMLSRRGWAYRRHYKVRYLSTKTFLYMPPVFTHLAVPSSRVAAASCWCWSAPGWTLAATVTAAPRSDTQSCAPRARLERLRCSRDICSRCRTRAPSWGRRRLACEGADWTCTHCWRSAASASRYSHL